MSTLRSIIMKQTISLMSEDERIQLAKECYQSLTDDNKLKFEFWIDTNVKIDNIHACYERQRCWKCDLISHVFHIRVLPHNELQDEFENYFQTKLVDTFCCKDCTLEFLEFTRQKECKTCIVELRQNDDPRKTGEVLCHICTIHESEYKTNAHNFGDNINL